MDDPLELLLKQVEKRAGKLTLSQVRRLIGSFSMGSIIAICGIVLAVVGGSIGVGRWYEAHFPVLQPSTNTTVTIARANATGISSIIGIPYKDQPEWYADHIYWLEQEGDRDKKARVIADYAIGAATYITTNSTFPFEFSLSVPNGYEIRSRAAFLLKPSPANLSFDLLTPHAADEAFKELRVSVPECDKGNSVLVLFRVSSRHTGIPITVTDVVKGTVK